MRCNVAVSGLAERKFRTWCTNEATTQINNDKDVFAVDVNHRHGVISSVR